MLNSAPKYASIAVRLCADRFIGNGDILTQPAQTAAQPQPRPDSAVDPAAERTRRFVALAFCRADLLFELDSEQKIVFAAGTTQHLLGKTPRELTNQFFPAFIDEASRGLVIELLDAADKDGRIDDVSVTLILGNGATSEAVMAGYQVPDFNDHFFIAVKVTPRAVTVKRQRKADRDMDAGVLTSEAFGSVAANRIRSFRDAGGDPKVTMIRIENLDELKQQVPESTQNKVMATIGGILNKHSLGGDTAGRVDDESFGFIHDGDVDADAVGREIEAATKEIHPDGIELSSKTSTLDADTAGMTDDQVTKALLYTMQEFARNKGQIDPVNMSTMLEERMAETMKSVAVFKKVCETGRFDLVYMPICHLDTGALHHFEALTRFRGGSADASPYKLIAMAEEVGIISEFDLAVAAKAVETITKHGIGWIAPVAINVSGHSIGNEKFIGTLHRMLNKHPGLSDALFLEITESAQITDLEGVNASIQSFRRKGFKVALDDFGAGAASFDYLNSFEVDTVKFDGPVVKRAFATEKGKAFLASMAMLCQQTGVETIAEMVEDEPLATFLGECGIELGQGWYFGKPESDPTVFKGKT